MKAGKEHRIPLSDAAVDLAEKLDRVSGSNHVFPAERGGELYHNVFRALFIADYPARIFGTSCSGNPTGP